MDMQSILVVDDEADIDLLIQQRFRRPIREGELEFLSARNGVEALTVLEGRPDISVVLCDINMPRMDGLSLLEHLRERFPLVKPVMISAYGDLENIRVAMNRGAFDFLTKPLDLRDLGVTVDRALAQAQRVRETLRSVQENRVLRMFVSEGVLRHLAQVKSEEQIRRAETVDATVAFFDVCGFTDLSEREDPARVVELLDVYFEQIVAAIGEHAGFVDKFIGDAVMAVFREPGHPRQALDAARAARAAVAAASAHFVPRFGIAPGIAVGVHSGPMLACSVGAHALGRFDFTVIGDTVNTAARLQDAAGPWEILTSEATRDRAGEGLRFHDRGPLVAKGKRAALRVFEVERGFAPNPRSHE